MTKNELSEAIVSLLRESGLSKDDQIKAISMARVAIQPRRSWEEVKATAKPILKPSERKK